MTTFTFTSPEGKSFDIEGPQGATPEQAFAVLQQHLSEPKDYKSLGQIEHIDVTKDMSGLDKFLAGAGKAYYDIGRGVGQLTGNVSQEQIDRAKASDKDLMATGAGTAGNIVGNLATTAPAMMVPGANTAVGGAVLGAGLGASQPVASDESRLANAALGGIGGGIGGKLVKGSARVVQPEVSPEVAALLKQKVALTPGQIMGGAFKKAEEKLTSVPILGDAISSAQSRSIESLNKAAYQRALTPIGESFGGDVGRTGVQEVQSKLGAAYNKLLPNLTFSADGQFIQDVMKIRGMAGGLPPAQQAQFEKLFQQQLMGKMTQFGKMNGEAYKEVESQLLREAKGYAGSADFDQRKLGAALGELVNSMKATLERSNPAVASELKSINEGWANYARIRAAAGLQGAKEGVFSPEQLSSAVRGQDRSVAKGSFAQGKAMMQDLSDAGRTVIGNRYPDSGTAGRLLLNVGALGSAAVNPAIPAALLGGASVYTRPGQRAMQAILAQRPEKARALANALRKAAPIGSIAGATEATK